MAGRPKLQQQLATLICTQNERRVGEYVLLMSLSSLIQSRSPANRTISSEWVFLPQLMESSQSSQAWSQAHLQVILNSVRLTVITNHQREGGREKQKERGGERNSWNLIPPRILNYYFNDQKWPLIKANLCESSKLVTKNMMKKYSLCPWASGQTDDKINYIVVESPEYYSSVKKMSQKAS